MGLYRWALAFTLLVTSVGFAATRDSEPPDRDMLKMIEFLREMEMIKQIDMLQDLHNLEIDGDPARSTTPQKSPPGKKKETAK